jgi:hypothetical protein
MAGRIRSIKPTATAADRDRFYRTTTLPKGAAVYFMRAGAHGPIKIGFAWDLRVRLCAIQPGNHEELTVVGWLHRGTRALERDTHRQFSALHIRGDWFRATAQLLAFIRSTAEGTNR